MVAIVGRGVLPLRAGPGQSGGFRRDGRGYTRMELAILLVPCHLAACVARERDRLTIHRGELICAQRTQWILGFILNGKEAVAVHEFQRMVRSIGVSADVVCQSRSDGLLRIENAREHDEHNRKHRQTQRMAERETHYQLVASFCSVERGN
jgi:hypothetical protein